MNKCICTTESLCCLSEINNIVNQLSSHKIKKKYLNDLKTFKFKNFWYVNILNLDSIKYGIFLFISLFIDNN